MANIISDAIMSVIKIRANLTQWYKQTQFRLGNSSNFSFETGHKNIIQECQ